MRPTLCRTVFIRDARGAAVKTGKAKICELERAEEKIYIEKVKVFNCGKREDKQTQEMSHMSYQQPGCQSFHFLFYSAWDFIIANLLLVSHCGFRFFSDQAAHLSATLCK